MKFYLPEKEVRQRAKRITLLVLDVDGVMTNGQLYFNDQGETIKAFDTLDGLGIKLLQQNGIEVAVISGRQSGALSKRASALGITRIAQGREDKFAALSEMLASHPVELNCIACAGDDLPDLQIMRRVGLAITVPNAHESVHRYTHACSSRPGGAGAVREIADFLLQAQGRYDNAIANFL
jgi:3-deoxy-D-manno-octulosonate 8-phosphate phosphatase (KDO 8-P phosphatase)